MRKPVVLVTGAAGEIGHALIEHLSEQRTPIVTVDLRPLEPEVERRVGRAITGSILEQSVLDGIQAEYAVERVYHLAALLSTRSEFTPVTAHEVNVRGTLNLLELAMTQARSQGRPVLFFYPSSIAAYGIPTDSAMPAAGWREHEHTRPTTMYGCNKLYCEQLGRYYARHYKQLDAEDHAGLVDFRALRFPGLISAVTLPSGGTSDYAPEMIHAAARGEPYRCFVRPDTRIPFMVMEDAVTAILQLSEAPVADLRQAVYNLAAFSPTAAEIGELVRRVFPAADIEFDPDPKRQAIVDSWPDAVDDAAARADWQLAPRYGLVDGLADYLMPRIARRYAV